MSVNRYRNALKAFLDTHAQVRTVLTGSKANFKANSKIIFTACNIEYAGQSTRGIVRTYRYLITICDIFDPNLETSEEDIYSDCNQIADDLLDFFTTYYSPDFSVEDTQDLQKFTNGHIDRTCGCMFTIAFDERREKNTCNIPLKTI